MSVINPQILAALLAATEGRSNRSLQLTLDRANRPSFGRTLSQSLAVGLGRVPGEAIGSTISDVVRTANDRSLAQEQRNWENAQVPLPKGIAEALGQTHAPRGQFGSVLDYGTALAKMADDEEPVELPADIAAAYGSKSVPRGLYNSAIQIALQKLESPDIRVTPDLRQELGIPVALPKVAPETLAAVPGGGMLAPSAWPEMDKARGAYGSTMPAPVFDRLLKSHVDLAGVAERRKAGEEKTRANKAREAIERDKAARANAVLGVRQQLGLAKLSTDLLKARFAEVAANLRAARAELGKARESIMDPNRDQSVAELEGVVNTLELQEDALKSEAADRQLLYNEGAAGPPQGTERPVSAPQPTPRTAGPRKPLNTMNETEFKSYLASPGLSGRDLEEAIAEAQRRIDAGQE